MRIGGDYPLIEFEMFGLDLLEPNAIIGDSILCITALILASKVHKMKPESTFFKYWKIFFILFGFSFFLGGIGHTFYNYLGVPGKYPGWYLGILAVYFVEQAAISIYPKEESKKLFKRLSGLKLLLALSAATLVFALVDLSIDPSVGLRVPSANTFIGFFFALGLIGSKYIKLYSPGFKFHVYSLFILIPSGLFQVFKISIAPWFDRNDLSHVFLWLSLFFYFWGINTYQKSLLKEKGYSRAA